MRCMGIISAARQRWHRALPGCGQVHFPGQIVAQQTLVFFQVPPCQVWRSVLLMLPRAGLQLEETRCRTATFIPCGISEKLDRGALACKLERSEILFIALDDSCFWHWFQWLAENGAVSFAASCRPECPMVSNGPPQKNKGSRGCLYLYRRYEQISASGAVSGSLPAGQSPQPAPPAQSRSQSSIRD
jgi:hypothetical protein